MHGFHKTFYYNHFIYSDYLLFTVTAGAHIIRIFECVPTVIKYLFATNSSAHSYNTRNKHKLRAAYGKHNFMYSNFRFVGIKIWNYITDHLDINITLPKFKKMLKIFIQTNDIKLLLS